MSRVGKHPVALQDGVRAEVQNGVLSVQGKLGKLEIPVSDQVAVTVESSAVVVKPIADTAQSIAMWGTTRNLVNNMVTGVSKGFTRELEINGVGYRAAVQGSNLVLQLGFSHDVIFPIEKDIKITCEKPTSISIFGIDKARVGETAAKIRSFKKPEPYKGKGIKYVDEKILRKEGKKK